MTMCFPLKKLPPIISLIYIHSRVFFPAKLWIIRQISKIFTDISSVNNHLFAESHEVTQLECESRWFPYNRYLSSAHLEPHLAAGQRIAVPGAFHFPHLEEPSGNRAPHSDGPNSQVCEYIRTQSGILLIFTPMRFQVREFIISNRMPRQRIYSFSYPVCSIIRKGNNIGVG